ncbi:MAG: hypothetical protein ACJAWS_001908 [Oleiphilaceae bacterium]|jgi:uncharacterized protein (DUF934 family)
MPKLIKNAVVSDNTCQTLDKEFSGSVEDIIASQTGTLVPKQFWLANVSQFLENDNVGVWLDSDEGPEELEPYLNKLNLIAINFPKFADGRGYSYARILRDRFGYEGELRAMGDILHDQMYYLKRCGFDAYAVREDKDADIVLEGLSDFSECYQASTDQKLPLFRRR